MTAKGLPPNKLIEAIHAASLSGVIKALTAGADIETADMHGYGGLPLRTACFGGNLAIVRELLSHGANPNANASDGPGAALRVALRMGHQDIVDLLLQNGAVMPQEVAIAPDVVLSAPDEALPGETVVPTLPEGKPDNIIEFTPSTSPLLHDPLPIDDADTPAHFGTETSLLSMDLLFLDENEMPNTPPPPKDKA
jgi:ankyrin repeat protein